MAKKAIANQQTAECSICDDPIVPGDFVGITVEAKMVHAGFHFTLNQPKAFCETGAIGIGHWDGKMLIDLD